MTSPTNSPVHHADNLFGICHRIGEDFGFNPLWLRIALGAAFIAAPLPVIAGYFALGGFVLASRMLFPNRRPADVVTLSRPTAQPELAKAA